MTLSRDWLTDDGLVHAMPSEIPACGRVGCTLRQGSHEHPDLDAGDRVVCEPRVATAPGWAWKSPHGTVYERYGDELLVDLDDDHRKAISAVNVVKERTWSRRSQQHKTKVRTMGKELPPLAYGEQLGLEW